MARFRFYVQPFNYAGNYTGTFTEITKYVQSVGAISIDTDSSNYQIGVFRTANFKIQVNNKEGLFSDVDQSESMFAYKRSNSIIKITYCYADDGPICGVAICGEEYLSEEVEIFRGLLNDDSLMENIKSQTVEFNCLGYETIFDQVECNFSQLNIGDTVAQAIYTILNQTKITNILTVSQANINPDQDQALDAVAHFENKTVKQVLDELLNASNSVLYIENQVVYVTDRTAGATVSYNFYGGASPNGAENIIDISNITNGIQRTFNFLTWSNTTTDTANQTSVAKYGIKKKDISYSSFTDTTKRLNIMNAIKDEFGLPKRELELTTPFDYNTLALGLLDRVDIDYPTIHYPWENEDLPICGVAVCGTAVLPTGLWTLTLTTSDNWKIIKKEMNLKNFSIKFKLRLI